MTTNIIDELQMRRKCIVNVTGTWDGLRNNV